MKALIKLRWREGWSGLSLYAYVRRLVFTWYGPFAFHELVGIIEDTQKADEIVTGRKLDLFTVDFRNLEVEGTLWKASGYPYLDISDLQNCAK